MLTDKELEEIRRKLQEVEEEPPVMAWQNIQQELKPEKRRRPFLWLWPLVLLLLTGTGVWYSQKQNVKIPEMAGNVPVNKTPADSYSASKPKDQERAAREKEISETGKMAVAPLKPEEKLKQAVKFKPAGEPFKISAETGNSIKNKTQRENKVIRILFVKTDGASNKPTKSEQAESVGIPGTQNSLAQPMAVVAIKPDSVLSTEAKPVISENSIAVTHKPVNINLLSKTDSLLEDLPGKGQKVDKPRKSESGTIGVLFAPRYAFRLVNANTHDEILVTDLKEANRLNAARMGFEYGLTYSKAFNPRWYFETALMAMELKENVEYSFTTGQLDPAKEDLTIAPDGAAVVKAGYITKDRKLKSSYRYGGLRLGATYYWGQKSQTRFNITAAAGANLLLKGRTAQYINGLWTETVYFPSKENILEQSNYNLLLGMGYNTHLLQNFELMVMPTLNYFLGSTYLTREPIGLRPYSVGLTFQVKHLFYKKL